MSKLTKKQKDQIYKNLIKKTNKKFDNLMISIERDKEFKKLDLSIAAFANVIIRNCSYFINDNYCLHKLKDTFQEILEDVANGNVIEAKQDRENIYNERLN